MEANALRHGHFGDDGHVAVIFLLEHGGHIMPEEARKQPNLRELLRPTANVAVNHFEHLAVDLGRGKRVRIGTGTVAFGLRDERLDVKIGLRHDKVGNVEQCSHAFERHIRLHGPIDPFNSIDFEWCNHYRVRGGGMRVRPRLGLG